MFVYSRKINATAWCYGGSSVSIVAIVWMTGVQFPARAVKGFFFFLCHTVQTTSGAHPASYPLGTGDAYPKGKVAGV